MSTQALFDNGEHQNYLLEDFGHGQMVQANQHLIIHQKCGIILDPGGHKVYKNTMSETISLLKGGTLTTIFFSHQDPDIIAAANGWLMTTNATAYISGLWTRFVPHFGLDQLVLERLLPIPDEGMKLNVGGCDLLVIPAHFLHSPGNFHIYDPISKILYSGDLGASLGMDYQNVTDFSDHVRYMKGFHERYMASGRALQCWANTVRQLDIETIAPQHGAFFKGKEMVGQFIDWCASLECGVDRLPDKFAIPA